MYLHDWSSKEDMMKDFVIENWWDNNRDLTEKEKEEFKNVNVLLASYSSQNYLGDAFVLFIDKENGKLYEVNASHCSCYGLEEKWEPEETDIESLKHRLEKGSLGEEEYSGNIFKKELREVLERLQTNGKSLGDYL